VWKAQVTVSMQKPEKRRLLKEAKKERLVGKKHFENAGYLFEQIKMLRHAASCFFTAQNYSKAAQIFESLSFFGQAAECLLKVQELSKAAKLYEQAGLVTKAIECLEANGDWEQLLHCLHRNKDFFKAEERQALINKYVPVALNSLYKLYSEDELDEANKGKLQELKIKMKYQKATTVIAEEDEDDDEDEPAPEDDALSPGGESTPVGEGDELADDISPAAEAEPEEEKEPAGDDSEEIEVIEEEYDLLEEVFQLKKQKSENEETKEQEKKVPKDE
jgi:tetratricopeptide (TPR) repeat protein